MRARALWSAGLLLAALCGGAAYLLSGVVRGTAVDLSHEPTEGDERPAGPSSGALGVAPRGASATDAAKGAGSIFGTVRLAGKPVAAKVLAWRTRAWKHARPRYDSSDSWDVERKDPTDRVPDATGEADASGRYEFAGLGPGDWLLRAVIERPAARDEESTSLESDGSRQRVDLNVVPVGLSLEVRTRRADGAPWKTRVMVHSPAGVVYATSDDAGVTHVAGLAEGEGWLDVGADGLKIQRRVRLPAPEPVVVVAPAGLVDVSGRVVAARRDGMTSGADVPMTGVGGARVRATAMLDRQGLWSVTTTSTAQPDGAFVLPVPLAATSLSATAPGFVGGWVALHGRVTGLVIPMRRGNRASGVVVEAGTGTPVPGVRVLARLPMDYGGGAGMRSPFVWVMSSAQSDAQGRFEIDVDRPLLLVAIGNGWCSKDLVAITRGETAGTLVDAGGDGSRPTTIEVERAARVVGTVLGVDGGPAADASVRVSERLPPQPNGARQYGPEQAYNPVVGADGTFVVDAVIPGVEVEAIAYAGHVPGPAVALGVLPAGAERLIELRLPKTRTLVATVLRDADGSPVEGAWIDGDQPGGRTDKTGTVRIGAMPATSFQIRAGAEPPLQGTQTEVPAAAEGEDETPVTVRLKRGADAGPTHPIAGTLRFPDGSPAAGGSVALRSREEEESCRSLPAQVRARIGRFVDVGVDGSFRLDAAGSDPLRLVGSAQRLGVDWSVVSEALPGAIGVALVLKESGTGDGAGVKVRVLDADGQPVAAATAWVTVSTPQRSIGDGAQIVDGDLVLDAMPGESVAVTVREARAADGGPLPVGVLTVGPTPIAEWPKEIRLPPERIIEGFVRTDDGKGVAGVTVRAQPPPPAETPGKGPEADSTRWSRRYERLAETRTTIDGSFRLRGLADGAYRLVAAAPTGTIDDADRADLAVVVRGGATGVVITLRRGVDVTLHVAEPDGRPVAGATWAWALEAGTAPSERRTEAQMRRSMRRMGGDSDATDEAGAVVLRGLDPQESYTLYLSAPRSRSDLRERTVEGWKPANDTIRLESVVLTRGVVRSPTGEPLSGVLVSWKGPSSTGNAVSGADGAFTIPDSVPGELELSAAGSDDSNARTTKQRALAGSQDVVLVVDIGAELLVRFDPSVEASELDALMVVREDAPRRPVRVTRQDGPGGTVRLRGLTAGDAYTVALVGWGHERVGYASGLTPSPNVTTIALRPAKAISVHWSDPKGLRGYEVYASRGGVRLGQAANAMSAQIPGLTEGRWRVEVRSGPLDGVVYAGEADADAGGDVEIRLEPRR